MQGLGVEQLWDLAPLEDDRFAVGGQVQTATTLGIDAAGNPVAVASAYAEDGLLGVWQNDGTHLWFRAFGSVFTDRVAGVAPGDDGGVVAVGHGTMQITIRAGRRKLSSPTRR